MIANGGTLEGKRYLKQQTVQLMTTNQLPDSIPFIGIGDERPGVGCRVSGSASVSLSESRIPIGTPAQD